MTKEERDLLIRDLCARLPYKIFVNLEDTEFYPDAEENKGSYDNYSLVSCNIYGECCIDDGLYTSIENIKPYLRPMESMTEEEKIELHKEHLKDERMFTECIERSKRGDDSMRGKVITHFAADWCNKKMFDYRGLIPMGLALPAKEGMYNN